MVIPLPLAMSFRSRRQGIWREEGPTTNRFLPAVPLRRPLCVRQRALSANGMTMPVVIRLPVALSFAPHASSQLASVGVFVTMFWHRVVLRIGIVASL